ncbi:MAG: hypothetical protein ACP5J4_14095 [Anaerolineae bacterium]
MPEEIVLDLGEYGEIVVESAAREEGGLRRVGRGEEKPTRRKIDAGALLRAPLTGLGRLFMATLPKSSPDDRYELDEFSVEFELALEAEAGSTLGAVAKITPSGAMTCTYTWKRKKEAAA